MLNKIVLPLALAVYFATLAYAEPQTMVTVNNEQVARLEAMHEEADQRVLQNDLRGAISIYSDILLEEPDDEVAYTRVGQLYLVLGRYRLAHQAFKNALDINPNNEAAAIGIQTIMDPDGVEGMISEAQIENEAEQTT